MIVFSARCSSRHRPSLIPEKIPYFVPLLLPNSMILCGLDIGRLYSCFTYLICVHISPELQQSETYHGEESRTYPGCRLFT